MVTNRSAFHPTCPTYAVQNMSALLTADTYVDETISADIETIRSVSVVGLKDKENKQLGVMLYFDGNPPTSDLDKEYCNVVIKGMSFKAPVTLLWQGLLIDFI